METKVAKFTFKVPDTHADAGKKIEKAFEYQECATEDEARNIMEFDSDGKARTKPWSIVEMVNDILKANARSNAYQNALLPYKPSDVSAEDTQEKLIRSYIRLGIPEEMARAQVLGMLAAVKSQAV